MMLGAAYICFAGCCYTVTFRLESLAFAISKPHDYRRDSPSGSAWHFQGLQFVFVAAS